MGRLGHFTGEQNRPKVKELGHKPFDCLDNSFSTFQLLGDNGDPFVGDTLLGIAPMSPLSSAPTSMAMVPEQGMR